MSDIDRLTMYSFKKGFSPFGFFTKLISEGHIKFNFGIVSLDLKDDDLRRVHDIILALDDRRAFYDAFGDEIPEHVVTSIRETKADIYATTKGIWANSWARTVVLCMLHDLGEFLTKIEKKPLPGVSEKDFEGFEKNLLELRLKVWTAVAHFVVVFGDLVRPYHLPPEILQEVQNAYNNRKK